MGDDLGSGRWVLPNAAQGLRAYIACGISLLTDAAVDPLSDQVCVTAMPRIFLDHVHEDLA